MFLSSRCFVVVDPVVELGTLKNGSQRWYIFLVDVVCSTKPKGTLVKWVHTNGWLLQASGCFPARSFISLASCLNSRKCLIPARVRSVIDGSQDSLEKKLVVRLGLFVRDIAH